MTDLDERYKFTQGTNSEILCDWFKHCIENEYYTAYDSIEGFLVRVGRRKFLTPLYTRLAKTEKGLRFANLVFAKASSGYHSVSYSSIREILDDAHEG